MGRHVDLPLGFHFKPTDVDLMGYLWLGNDPYLLSSWEFVLEGNLKCFRIDQPPDVRRDGYLGKLYWYIDCSYKEIRPGQMTRDRDRRTDDGKGTWMSRKKQQPVYHEGKAVGYKEDFKFHHKLEPGKKKVPTTWAMTEYTMYSNESNVENLKAICVLHNTKEEIKAAKIQYGPILAPMIR